MRVLLAIIITFVLTGNAFALPAFPGAEGAAAEAVGGRGGTVYTVTNLNDSGAGSFRAACEASGARIVVFAVSGWIDLTTDLEISNSNITIAGQTSPGGIGVRGRTTVITASQVIIMHMRFAAGSFRADELDSLRIWGSGESPAANNDIILDHCSIRWGCDESGETAYNPGRVTISWSVIGPGLNNCAPEANHNLGFLVWGGNDSKITLHHNYFPHNRYRNPEVNGGSGETDDPYVDLVNNVGFDSYGGYTGYHGYAGQGYVNLVHNYFKKASEDNADAREGILFDGAGSGGNASIYSIGNNGAWRSSWDDGRTGYQDWDALKTEWDGATPHTSWRKLTPNAMPGLAVTATNMDATYAANVVANSGATMPTIDTHDALYKTDYTNTIQRFLDGDAIGNETGDYPTLSGGTYPTDADGDGMADSWEASHGVSSSGGHVLNADYTDLEMYLFSIGGYSVATSLSKLTGGGKITGGTIR